MARISTTERGFSLVEVVIAIGIFAGAIAAILGLFGPLNRSVSEVGDSARAARLAEAINVELLRLRDAQTGTPTQTKIDQFAATFANGAVLRLVGSHDGSRVIRESDAGNDATTGTPRGIAARDRYFLIEVSASPGFVSGQLSYLPLIAVVRWPHHIATGVAAGDYVTSEASQAHSLMLNYALGP